MNFSTTFDMDKTRIDRIPVFFKARGYKLELDLPGNYRFSRGSSWTAAIIRNVRNLPTRVEVLVTAKEATILQVLVLYDIDTLNRVISREWQEVINAELQSLQDFCQKST